MVIAIVKPKVYTGKSQMEEFAEDFRNETKMMLKKIALENNCDVDELKFTVDNQGVVNVQRMTPEEKISMAFDDIAGKRVSDIKKARGL